MSKEGIETCSMILRRIILFQNLKILWRISIVSLFRSQDLSTGWLHCDPGLPFKPKSYPLPGWVRYDVHWFKKYYSSIIKKVKKYKTIFLPHILTSIYSKGSNKHQISGGDNFCRQVIMLILCFLVSVSMEGMVSYAHSVACFSTWTLCIDHSTFRRFLCKWSEAGFQDQGSSSYLFIDCVYLHHNYISLCILQDFGDSIPGHGGFTDRMDCQVLYFHV